MTPVLRVTDFEWREALPALSDQGTEGGTDGAPIRLLATLHISGCDFHVNAWLVEYRRNRQGSYYPDDRCLDQDCDGVTVVLGRDEDMTGDLWEVFGRDGGTEVVYIEGIGKGRPYAIFIEPFCR